MPEPLRVMTFNILYETAPHPAGGWQDRRPLVTHVIREWQPDIVGLQEAVARQLDDLEADLPDYALVRGPASGVSRLPVWARTVSPPLAAGAVALYRSQRGAPRQRLWRAVAGVMLLGAAAPVAGALGARVQCGAVLDEGEHCAILYRRDDLRLDVHGAFWLSSRPARAGSVLLGSWLPRVVNWARLTATDGSLVTVVNTHVDYLPWASARTGARLRSFMEETWDGAATQVLLGDFNATSGSRLFRGLAGGRTGSAPFREAWRDAAERVGPQATLHDGAGRERWPGRIDYIFLRTPWQVERAITITDNEQGAYPSDHFPVLAELRRAG